jgi:hypothetical protein
MEQMPFGTPHPHDCSLNEPTPWAKARGFRSVGIPAMTFGHSSQTDSSDLCNAFSKDIFHGKGGFIKIVD